MADFDPSNDYYKILGVEPTAQTADIRTAHKRLTAKKHPDVTGDDGEAQRRLNEACAVLTRDRDDYDSKRQAYFAAQSVLRASAPSRQDDPPQPDDWISWNSEQARERLEKMWLPCFDDALRRARASGRALTWGETFLFSLLAVADTLLTIQGHVPPKRLDDL